MSEQAPIAAPSIEETLSRVRSLSRRRARQISGKYWIEGVRHFVQACDSNQQFETVIHSPILLKSDLAQMLVRRLGASGARRIRVTPEQFRSVSLTDRASGIGAVVAQRWTPLDMAEPGRGLCWLVLEQIRSPGNLGTILRTAEAVGASGIILVGSSCDPFDPAVLRASMGGIFHLPLVRTTPEALRRWAARHGVLLIGLSPEAQRLWTDLPQPGPFALVLGEERCGLSRCLRELCQTAVRLPMTGRADSLNIGVAAGVMMYELARRDHESG